GTTTRQQVGYPINGWWQRPYTFKDLDGNGIITANEITVADSAVFVGYANPRWEITYTTGFDLLHKRLRIVGLFDHKSGYYQLHGRRPEPLEGERLQRHRSRGELFRRCHRRGQQLPDRTAADLLDIPTQRRVLSWLPGNHSSEEL